jgi:uncharacterized membrane protein HdeD (DUF308 family)
MLGQIDVLIVRVTPEMVQHWRWFLAFGIVLLVLGIAAIARSVASTVVSMVFFGWVLLFAGRLFERARKTYEQRQDWSRVSFITSTWRPRLKGRHPAQFWM